jgi:GTP-binding protein Era
MDDQMQANEHPEEFRSGYAAVVGRPNVGKSTLINRLLGQKIAAVSSKPQTTRQKQLGILNLPDAQIVLIDTPGIHIPRHKLGRGMNALAADSLAEADAVLWLVDASDEPHPEDELITEKLAALKEIPPVLQILNKKDILDSAKLEQRLAVYAALYPEVDQITVSAKSGDGVGDLIAWLKDKLPVGVPYYPVEQVTDYYEREIAADLIREAALERLREEVPHAIAVRIDEYSERDEQGAFIAATIFVEKESQKGIVIGKGGIMLKAIGSDARKAIEAMSGRRVFLELRVKVNKNWRSNADFLRQMGYEELEGAD